MAPTSSSELLEWLRAAGETSRLRLLALCAQRDLSVSDLAQALGQSEPRVSRHLKILCEAGLLERLRQGQWVHYRLAENAAAASFAQGLLAQLDRKDPLLTRDRARVPANAGSHAAGAGGGAGTSAKGSESRLGRALGGFVEGSDLGGQLRSALVVGVEHLELLESAAATAAACTAIAHSRRAAQSARAFAERRGFGCRVLLAASSDGLSEKDIARAGESFDAVFLDHLAVPDSAFAGMLACGRRALAPAGRLWLFERYESLEGLRERVVEHPLARLRRLLGDVGLTCERLGPIEADGEHVLAALAVPAIAAPRGAGSVSAA
jgi:DNA-binding transcriptional ArsR family regulator